MNQRPKWGSEGRGVNVRFWVNLPVGNSLNLGFYTCRWAFDTGS